VARLKRWRRQPLRLTFIIGTALGAGGAALYLAMDGAVVLFVPRWARIVFAPGFAVGRLLYGEGLGSTGCAVAGCLAVGLSYGAALIALLALFRRRRGKPRPRRRGKSRKRRR
jgi:hypothetical protein